MSDDLESRNVETIALAEMAGASGEKGLLWFIMNYGAQIAATWHGQSTAAHLKELQQLLGGEDDNDLC
jgi:hypothetical protein